MLKIGVTIVLMIRRVIFRDARTETADALKSVLQRTVLNAQVRFRR